MRLRSLLRPLKPFLVRRSEVMRRYDDQRYILGRYRAIHQKDLDTKNPRTFTEKLFCRMLALSQRGDPVLTKLTDKCLAREYVQERVGRSHLVDLLWTGSDPTEIPFDDLPPKCVIKANHGSGMNLFLQNGYDRESVIRITRGWLGTNHYYSVREYQYYDINPKILVETLLDDGHQDGPLDYRFWCFSGRPEVIRVNNHKRSVNAFYDLSWQKLPLRFQADKSDADIAKPENFEAMVAIASKLSSGLDFVRLDLYSVFGRVYFGEFTFTPLAGNLKFVPDHWDLDLGRKWILNRVPD
jgi:hypothetical protein